MLVVKVNGDAPLEAGAGYAQVLKAGQQEVVQHLVCAGGRLNELGMILDVLDKAGSVLAHLEEVALFLYLFNGPAAVGAAAVLQLTLKPEALAGGAVQAFVGGLVDIALLVELFEYLLNACHVIVIGGADKAVVGNVHQLPQVLEGGNDIVNVLLGGNALFLGLALYLLAVLVGAGEEVYVIAGHALIAGDGVSCHGGIAVADVQLVAGVINRRSDVECLLVGHSLSPSVYGL